MFNRIFSGASRKLVKDHLSFFVFVTQTVFFAVAMLFLIVRVLGLRGHAWFVDFLHPDGFVLHYQRALPYSNFNPLRVASSLANELP